MGIRLGIGGNYLGGGGVSWSSYWTTHSPSGLSITSDGSSLSWASNSSSKEDGFYIYCQIDGGAYSLLGTVGKGVVTYSPDQTIIGNSFNYKVCAYSSAHLSNFTSVVNFTWTAYWAAQTSLFLFFGQTANIASGKLNNEMAGSSDYITVTGTGLNAIYAAPNNSTYKTADAPDYTWFKSDGSVSTCDGNRLIAYDFGRTLVQYDDASPYTIRWIAILNPAITVTNNMRSSFYLSIWWNNTLSLYGHVKGNRTVGQSVWTPESTYPSCLTDGNTFGWYSIDDLTKITYNPTTKAVSAWADKLGSSNTLNVLHTSATLQSDGVLFNQGVNTDDLVRLATLNQPIFFYMVVKQIAWSSGKYLIDGKADYAAIYQATATPGIAVWAGTPGSSTESHLSVGSFGIIRCLIYGENSKLIVNGNNPITGNFGSANAGGITLGNYKNGNTGANVKIAELIVRSISDVPADESNIYGYLKTKYGL